MLMFHSLERFKVQYFRATLHKKYSFQIRISSVNVTKPQETADFVTFTEEILNEKLCVVLLIFLKTEKCGGIFKNKET